MKKLFVFLIICFVCQSYQMEEDEEEFDPLEAMRRLWETEVAEGEIFRQQLRDEGVNVTEWEEKLSQGGFDSDNQGQDNIKEEL